MGKMSTFFPFFCTTGTRTVEEGDAKSLKRDIRKGDCFMDAPMAKYILGQRIYRKRDNSCEKVSRGLLQ